MGKFLGDSAAFKRSIQEKFFLPETMGKMEEGVLPISVFQLDVIVAISSFLL